MQVGGFDVAVDHALAVQAAQRLGDVGGGGGGLRHAEAVFAVQHLLQGFAAVPVVEQVETAGAQPGGQHVVHLHQVLCGAPGHHAFGQPGFVRQHGALLGVVGTLGVEGFQRIQLPGGHVAHLVEDVDAAVGHGGGDGQAVYHLTHLQARRNRQLLGVAVLVGQGAVEQAPHAHHQRGGVVVAACGQGGCYQGGAQSLAVLCCIGLQL